jgi:hypothetical protein
MPKIVWKLQYVTEFVARTITPPRGSFTAKRRRQSYGKPGYRHYIKYEERACF